MMRFSYALPPDVETKRTNVYSEQQWKELLRRNHVLAKEVSKLKSENKEIRNQLNSVLLLKLTANSTLSKQQGASCEVGIQTEEDRDHSSATESFSTPVNNGQNSYDSPSHNGNKPMQSEAKVDTIDINTDSYFIFNSSESLKAFSTPSAMKTLSSKSDGSSNAKESPVQNRVSQELASRLVEGSSMFSTPTIERKRAEVDTPLSSRASRSTRKPVSYLEPSLKVKVRKGFEFFKFQANEDSER